MSKTVGFGLAVVAVILGILGLTGCGGADGSGGEVLPAVVYVDGKPVKCVIYDGGSYAGGLSCNWDEFNAR